MAIRLPKRKPARRTAVVTDRAQVLDGCHLWLHVTTPVAGKLGVLDPEGALFPLLDDPVPQGGPTSVIASLGALAPADDAFDLILVGEGRKPLPVVATPGTCFEVFPTQSPVCPDPLRRFSVTRGPTGQVTIRPHPVEPTSEVLAVGRTDQALIVRWAETPGTGRELVVLEEDGTVVEESTGTSREGIVTAEVDGVPGVSGPRQFGLATTGERGFLPLTRLRNDLARPQRSVLMPSVASAGRNVSLTWHRSGTLMLSITPGDR